MARITILRRPDPGSGADKRGSTQSDTTKGKVISLARETGMEYKKALKPKRSEKRMEFNPHLPNTLTPKGYAAMNLVTNMANKQYTNLVAKLRREKKLWEDPDFPADDRSLGRDVIKDTKYEWKRPREMTPGAEFMTGGVSRFDIKQGRLGDCWFIAVIASIANYPQLFDHVLPKDQVVNGEGYCGVIRCRFWRFGEWKQVLIDDRLPVMVGKNEPAFMHSSDPHEYWSALLEKAYAKLNGCYGHLTGGTQSEAMEDVTGGICHTFKLKDAKDITDLYARMLHYAKKCCLMGCAMESDVVEAKMEHGLIGGHAYSVTMVHSVTYHGKKQHLVRIRNPWGNRYEWTGPWADNSKEWKSVSAEDKKNIHLSFSEDGEFWMSIEDFIKYFTVLEVCYLGLESLEHDTDFRGKRRLEEAIFAGKWEKNVSAGGCINNRSTYGMNPQFSFTVVDPDPDDNDDLSSINVGLMQKSRRKLGKEFEVIGFMIYKAPQGNSTRLTSAQLLMQRPVCRSPFANTREVTLETRVTPGQYIIVPSTFEAGVEVEFIVRVFTEKAVKDQELDDRDRDDGLPDDVLGAIDLEEGILGETETMEDEFKKVCKKGFKSTTYIGLQKLLNTSSLQDVPGFTGFTKEMCRSMVASVDSNLTGELELNEFLELWKLTRGWKIVFLKHDIDRTGSFSAAEFREALNDAGFHVSNVTISALVHRYMDCEKNSMSFEDYILCMLRLKTAHNVIEAHPKNREKANLFANEDLVRFMAYI